MTKRELIKGTLAWCNAQRKLQGKEPLSKLPKGKRLDAYSCPCGKATDLNVGVYTYSRKGQAGLILPWVVTCFVQDFDQGRFPEYIDEN